MKRKFDYKTLNLMGSILLLLAVLAGFFWLWNTRNAKIAVKVSPKYEKIQIEELKKEATSLVETTENLSGMPLQAPSADKIGRDNPFVAY